MKKLLILILLLAGCVQDDEGNVVYEQPPQKETPSTTEEPLEENDNTEQSNPDEVPYEESEEPVEEICEFQLFEYAPVNIEETKVFLPLGLMTGSHVTPIDHHYFQNFDNDKYDIEIYAPGAGVITSVQHMPGAPDGEDYRIVIDHGCGVESVFIHLGVFSDALKELAPELQGKDYISPNHLVAAGELLGYYKTNVDYNIVDYNFTLTGFVNPDSYRAEQWKQHIPDTYDYFVEEIRQQLIDISLRTVEPIEGKIDYDIKGKLVGNWFLEDSNGYAGDSTNMNGYWMGHLAIAYDAYDPTRVVFSIGNYLGENSRQYAVKGNTPDPADVGVENGLIIYELVGYDWLTQSGTHWNRKDLEPGLTTYEFANVEALLLVQVIDDETIHFEVFHGFKLGDVTSFTDNMKVYKR